MVTGSSNAKTAAKKAVGDLEREVQASQKRVADAHKKTERVISDSQKTVTREAINQEKIRERSHKNYLRSLETGAKQTAARMRSTFSDVFAGTFLGVSASAAVTAGFSRVFAGLQTAFQKSLDFSQMKTSLAQFEGSMSAAEDRIKSLLKVAQDTPGLGFLSAIDGQKRLMAIGFEGDRATKILTGLSKVRVLSGATKEDFDAMLINLVQIASGGQKVTQELREMAGRMPAIVDVIQKEFGAIDGSLNEIDPKEFVSRLADAMSKTQADANQTGLAVENLQDSFDRLYIAIGSIIEQNPEIVAGINFVTRALDGNTNALMDNESGVRRNAEGWASWLGKIPVRVANGLELMGTGFQNLGRLVAAVGLSIYGAMQGIVMAVLAPVNTVIAAVNKLKSVIGQFAPALSMLPGGYGVLAGLSNMPDIQSIGPDFGSISGTIMQKDFIMQDFWKARADSNRRMQQNWADYYKGLADIRASQTPAAKNQRLLDRVTDDTTLQDVMSGTRKNFRDTSTVDSGGARGGTSRTSRAAEAGLQEFVTNRVQAEFEKAMRKLPQSLKNKIASQAGRSGIPLDLAFAQIFSESRFNPRADSGQAGGLTQFTPGTARRFGFTVDELKNNPDKALTAWGKYMSFLFDRYGDWELATLAYHQGEGTVDKLVNLLDKGKGAAASKVIGPKGKAYIAQISALSGIRGKEQFQPGDPRDIDKYLEQNAFLTPDTSKITREIDLSPWREEIKLNEQRIEVYQELQRAIFELTERTKEEVFWFDYKLGKYPQFNEEQAKEIAQTWALIDASEKKKKTDEEMTRQAEDFAREQQRLFEETAQGWENLLTDLSEGNFRSIWDNLRRSMLEQFIRPASQMLAQLFGNPFGGAQMAGAGFGGFSIPGFGGGSMGPGGTPMFNPASSGGFNFAGGQSGGFGNIGSMFGGLFGRSSGGGTFGGGAVGGSLAGSLKGGGIMGKLGGMGGIAGLIGMGASIAGGAIGGKAGNALSMAGMGAMIGLQFGGPWGALIGGAIGGAAGLFSMLFGRDNAEKKLKEAALNTYGITVKDKSVLKTLKRLGETMFGKGNVGKNAAQVVSSDEGQLILRNYAEATNQSSSKIDQLYISDENWKGNQFRSQFGGFRAMGGPVSAGTSYVVGERGPELFTPKASGTVTPNGGYSQEDRMMIGLLIDTIQEWKEQLRSFRPGEVVAIGAKENPSSIRGAMESEYRNDLRASEVTLRLQGAY